MLSKLFILAIIVIAVTVNVLLVIFVIGRLLSTRKHKLGIVIPMVQEKIKSIPAV